jgi:hypothetical protein
VSTVYYAKYGRAKESAGKRELLKSGEDEIRPYDGKFIMRRRGGRDGASNVSSVRKISGVQNVV